MGRAEQGRAGGKDRGGGARGAAGARLAGVAGVRLGGGRGRNRDGLRNHTAGRDGKVTQVKKGYLDRYEDTGALDAGDIGCLCGMPEVRIGDILGDPGPVPGCGRIRESNGRALTNRRTSSPSASTATVSSNSIPSACSAVPRILLADLRGPWFAPCTCVVKSASSTVFPPLVANRETWQKVPGPGSASTDQLRSRTPCPWLRR